MNERIDHPYILCLMYDLSVEDLNKVQRLICDSEKEAILKLINNALDNKDKTVYEKIYDLKFLRIELRNVEICDDEDFYHSQLVAYYNSTYNDSNDQRSLIDAFIEDYNKDTSCDHLEEAMTRPYEEGDFELIKEIEDNIKSWNLYEEDLQILEMLIKRRRETLWVIDI